MDSIEEEQFLKFKEYVEVLEGYAYQANISDQEKNKFLDQILVIKLGGKLPINFFSDNSDIRDFFDINKFGNQFFTAKISVQYDAYDGLSIPLEMTTGSVSWYLWENLIWEKTDSGYSVKRGPVILFKTSDQKILTDDYSVLIHGITEYSCIKTANLRPFKKVNNISKACYFDIMINSVDKQRVGTSYILETHVYMELFDKDGNVRSFGQDIFDHIRSTPIYGFFRAGDSASIIQSPDCASYYPHNYRITNKIRFPISQKEHDRIIAIVESDKYNNQRTAELLKSNCVSYTARIAKLGINYHIHTDVSLLEIIGRELIPKKYDGYIRKISSAYKTKPKWTQILTFCFPPIYCVSFLLGVFIITTSVFGYKNHREYNIIDCLFRPWKIRCDVPRVMFQVLSKYVNKKGEIDRNKYPPGYLFD